MDYDSVLMRRRDGARGWLDTEMLDLTIQRLYNLHQYLLHKEGLAKSKKRDR